MRHEKESAVQFRLRQRRSMAEIALRLLLAVSLWHAPIVWGHCHETDDSELADHVARFHAHDSASINMEWHWHVSLPDRQNPNSSRETQRDSDFGEVTAVCGLVAREGEVSPSCFTRLSLTLSPSLMHTSLKPHRCDRDTLRSRRLSLHQLCRMSC